MYAGDTESTWVGKLIHRDGEAWALFFERYQPLVAHRIHAAFSELGRPWQQPLAEEVAAEVVFVLLRDDAKTLRLFQGRSRFSTWLSTVIRRTALSMILRHARSEGGNAAVEFDLHDAPADWTAQVQADQEERLVVLRSCLKQLSVEDQQILKWHYFEHHSYSEIALRLCIRENSVGPKLSRARKRLKRLIHQRGGQYTIENQTCRTPSGGAMP